jgi:PIN domain nuclease of toxin-antitoxin system
MNYLIDTHTLLWFLWGSEKLSYKAKQIIENTDNKVFISIVSIWEIAIKANIGKLVLPKSFESLQSDLKRFDIEILPIYFSHTKIYLTLELHHRDPFDRILVAQCIDEDLILVSADEIFDTYAIKQIW